MDLWAALIVIVAVIHFFVALFTGKRDKNLAVFANYFVTYMYNFVRYATFTSNLRPFPWNDFGKPVEKPDMKKKH